MEMRENRAESRTTKQQDISSHVAQLTLYECYPGGPIVRDRNDCFGEKPITPDLENKLLGKPEAPTGKAHEQRYLPNTTIKM